MNPEAHAVQMSGTQRETVCQLIKDFLPGTEIWAYGSRAKGTARAASDLDLVAMANPEQARQVSALKEAFEESNLPFRVDLFVWDTLPVSFKENILREKKVLIPKDG